MYTIRIIELIKNEIERLKEFWRFFETDTTAECKIPMSVFESIARVLLPEITKFFESNEGKKEYEQYRQGLNQTELKTIN